MFLTRADIHKCVFLHQLIMIILIIRSKSKQLPLKIKNHSFGVFFFIAKQGKSSLFL